MNRLVTIVYLGKKVETILVNGTMNQCEDQAFNYADQRLGLVCEEEKSQIELFFHDSARSHVLFSDITVYQ